MIKRVVDIDFPEYKNDAYYNNLLYYLINSDLKYRIYSTRLSPYEDIMNGFKRALYNKAVEVNKDIKSYVNSLWMQYVKGELPVLSMRHIPNYEHGEFFEGFIDIINFKDYMKDDNNWIYEIKRNLGVYQLKVSLTCPSSPSPVFEITSIYNDYHFNKISSKDDEYSDLNLSGVLGDEDVFKLDPLMVINYIDLHNVLFHMIKTYQDLFFKEFMLLESGKTWEEIYNMRLENDKFMNRLKLLKNNIAPDKWWIP